MLPPNYCVCCHFALSVCNFASHYTVYDMISDVTIVVTVDILSVWLSVCLVSVTCVTNICVH